MRDNRSRANSKYLMSKRSDEMSLADVLMRFGASAVCVYDSQDRIVRWNERYLLYFPEVQRTVRVGLPFIETVISFFALQHPEATYEEQAAAVQSALLRHQREEGPIQYQRADGRWLELRMFPQTDGGRIKVWNDVTREKAPGTDATHLLDLMTVLNIGLVLHGPAGNLLYVNSRFFSESFLGLLTKIPSIEERHSNGIYWREFKEIFISDLAFEGMCGRIDIGPLTEPVVLRTRSDQFFRIQEQAWRGGIASVWSNLTELIDRKNALRAAHAELVVLNDRLRLMSEQDDLTGLPNRRCFNTALVRAQASLVKGRSCIVGILDLDHFKSINDRYGHDVGDDVLIETGRRVVKVLESGDVIARLGGEEFGLLLHNTTLEQAATTAQRILEALDGQPFAAGKAEVELTGSLGLAALEVTRSSADSLREADRALYIAKNLGRNQFVTV